MPANAHPVTYTATIEGTTTTGFEVPAGVIDQLGAGRRPAVVVTLGDFTFRTTVGVMGGRCLIPISKERREQSGIASGQDIEVTLAVNTEPRIVEVPDDLAAALAEADVTPAFDALAPSRRKEHVRSVVDAKAPETRLRRIVKVVGSLSS